MTAFDGDFDFKLFYIDIQSYNKIKTFHLFFVSVKLFEIRKSE
jgi:hypothetical protein